MGDNIPIESSPRQTITIQPTTTQVLKSQNQLIVDKVANEITKILGRIKSFGSDLQKTINAQSTIIHTKRPSCNDGSNSAREIDTKNWAMAVKKDIIKSPIHDQSYDYELSLDARKELDNESLNKCK
ncbi:MAG: hypothetical protein H0T62_00285 [Parachlamydiaceae bacterium]|nr:hypothetical protein [Parachlamydiaceae bacterium]